MSSRIADQQESGCREGRNRSPAWNEPAAAFPDPGLRKSEERLGMGKKGLEIGLGSLARG
jgi:hypothetical protein